MQTGSCPVAVRKINVVFRFDDPSAKSDWALEKAVLEVFQSYGLPLTAAVVPIASLYDPPVSIEERFPEHLAAACRDGWLEIAQHGLTHAVRTTGRDGKPSEFRGLPLEEQARLVREGRDLIQRMFGRSVAGFIPPFNSYDGDTALAVREAGMEYLSGGVIAVGGRADLVIIPQTTALIGLHKVVESARCVPVLERTIIAVFHHFDFAESNSGRHRTDLAALGKLLQWLVRQPDVRIMKLEDVARHGTARSWSRALWMLQARHQLPRLLRDRLPAGFLLHRGLP